MKIIKIDKNNQVNGAGLRCVIWVSGCENHCPQCHNPETWDYNLGQSWSEEDSRLLQEQMQSSEISGITLTGGDPFAPHNRKAAAAFCMKFKMMYPNKTIWAYTGHLYEELIPYLTSVDVLVDGRYNPALNPGIGRAKWRGSTNQRVIDVQKSLKAHKIVEYIDFNGKTISENERS